MQKQEKTYGELLCGICGEEISSEELPDTEEQSIPKLICWECCSQIICGLIEDELFCDMCGEYISLEDLKESEELKEIFQIQGLKEFVCIECCILQSELA